MRLKTANNPHLKHGTTRILKRFAWVPADINGNIIWLESYQIIQGYICTTYAVMVDDKPVNFILSKWITLSKRVIM